MEYVYVFRNRYKVVVDEEKDSVTLTDGHFMPHLPSYPRNFKNNLSCVGYRTETLIAELEDLCLLDSQYKSFTKEGVTFYKDHEGYVVESKFDNSKGYGAAALKTYTLVLKKVNDTLTISNQSSKIYKRFLLSKKLVAVE